MGPELGLLKPVLLPTVRPVALGSLHSEPVYLGMLGICSPRASLVMMPFSRNWSFEALLSNKSGDYLAMRDREPLVARYETPEPSERFYFCKCSSINLMDSRAKTHFATGYVSMNAYTVRIIKST